MPSTCAVISCLNTCSVTVSLHRVPEGEKGKRWKDFVSYVNRGYKWRETKVIYICSSHFKNESFVRPALWKRRRRIAQNAFPTLVDGREITVLSEQEANRTKPLTLFKEIVLPFKKASAMNSSVISTESHLVCFKFNHHD